MNRSKEEQTAHNKEVDRIANHYKILGYTVEADISGWPYPEEINGKIPDVIAKKTRMRTNHGSRFTGGAFPEEEKIIVEVETESTKNSSHAIEQARAFSLYANARPGVKFEIVVI